MSVVVKDCQNGNISLLSKGADEAILPYAHAGKPIPEFLSFLHKSVRMYIKIIHI